jgi:hypothetical protein
MECNKCGREVIYVQSSLLGRHVRSGVTQVAFVTARAQHVVLEDGTMVAVPAGTVLSGHVLHDPLCPGRYKAAEPSLQEKGPDNDGD